MPDGDRFERKLRGKGWRSVYRLGCCSAPLEAVVDKIMGAAAHAFRTEGVEGIRGIYSEVRDALNRSNASLFQEPSSQQAFDELTSRVQSIVIDEGCSEISRLSERAALRTFNEMEGSSRSVTDDEVKQQFTRNLVSELSERRCLGPAREGVMLASGRDQEAQLTWEAEVRDASLKPCATLSSSLLSEEDNRTIRAPKRLFKQKLVTLEMLNEALPVMGKSL